jgi:CubicO group peptidase (beta-lactamase class C family)
MRTSASRKPAFAILPGGTLSGLRQLTGCILAALVSAAVLAPAAAQPSPSSDAPSQAANEERFRHVRETIATGHKAIRAVVVFRADQPLFEYSRGRIDPGERADVFAVSKSVTSILIGIALGQGKLRSLDEPISDFLPEVLAPGADPRAAGITIRHLLTMTSGFDPDAGSSLWDWSLRRPMIAAPGEKFNDERETANILAVLLARAVKQDGSDFARQNLFRPLGITSAEWRTDDEGHLLGAYGLALSARDMVKIGSLYLHQGQWNGRQIVPEWFVAESVAPHIVRDPADHGYLWWVGKPIAERRVYLAAGGGGQFILVSPALNTVVAVQSDSDGPILDGFDVVRLILATVRNTP